MLAYYSRVLLQECLGVGVLFFEVNGDKSARSFAISVAYVPNIYNQRKELKQTHLMQIISRRTVSEERVESSGQLIVGAAPAEATIHAQENSGFCKPRMKEYPSEAPLSNGTSAA